MPRLEQRTHRSAPGGESLEIPTEPAVRSRWRALGPVSLLALALLFLCPATRAGAAGAGERLVAQSGTSKSSASKSSASKSSASKSSASKSSASKSSSSKSSASKSSASKSSASKSSASKSGSKKKSKSRSVALSVSIEELADPAPATTLPATDPELAAEKVQLRNAYLSARAAFNRGDHEQARLGYLELLETYPAMSDYMLRDLGRMLLLDDATPDLPLARETAESTLSYGDRLLAQPGTVLKGWGHYLRGRGLQGLQRMEEAEAALSMALAAENGPSQAIVYYYYGEVCEAAERPGDAYVHYVFAGQLGSGSYKTKAEAAAARVAVGLDPAERGIDWYLRRDELQRLVQKGRHKEALQLIQEARARCSVPEVTHDLRRLEGYCYLRLNRHDEAEALLLALMDEEVTGGRPSWETIAALQKEMGKRGDAQARLSLLKRFVSSHPTADGLEAFFLTASLLKDEGQQEEAEALYQQVAELYPDRPEAHEARWLLAWARIRRGEHESAITALTGIVEGLSDRSDEAARARYWLARMLVLTGEKKRGEAMFADVGATFPNSYYGAMADWRLQGGYPRVFLPEDAKPDAFEAPAMAAEPATLARTLLFPGWSEHLERISAPGPAQHLDKAKELWLMGSSEEAVQEILAAVKHPEADSQARWMGAALRHTMGGFSPGLWYGHLFLSSALPGDQTTPEQRALAFPMPYMKGIVKWSFERRLEPALVAALIQQESTFRPTVKSPVGAAGLMQMMPYTGKEVCGWLDIRGYQSRYLTRADFNLRLGTEYLREMLTRYNGSLARTLASYNAGPGAVNRWNDRFGDVEDDVFAEEIPYKETRVYVRKVLRNFYGYLNAYHSSVAFGLPHDAAFDDAYALR